MDTVTQTAEPVMEQGQTTVGHVMCMERCQIIIPVGMFGMEQEGGALSATVDEKCLICRRSFKGRYCHCIILGVCVHDQNRALYLLLVASNTVSRCLLILKLAIYE